MFYMNRIINQNLVYLRLTYLKHIYLDCIFYKKKIMSLTMYEEQRELGCTVTGE